MKQLSIVIVTYKSEQDIYECLKSIWKYCDIPKEELEVIIIDNSPECEPMFSKLKELYGDDIMLIHNTHNGGYGQGNNIGIRQAKAPVIMIMNPDVRMMQPVYKKATKAFDHNPKLSIYGMQQMLSPTQKSRNSFICTDHINGYIGTLLNAFCSRLNWYIPRYMFFSGSCFFLRKDMFCAIGMYDEKLFMYGEEADIHYRMIQRFGKEMKFNPALRYIHLTKERELTLDTLQKILLSCIRQNEKNGQPRQKTILHRWQSNRVLLLMEWIKTRIFKKDSHPYDVLTAYGKYLKEEMKKLQ